EKAGNFLQRALGGGEAYALKRTICEGFKALQRECQMRTAFGGNQGMNLIDDDGVDGAKCVGGLGGEQQIERLRGGDEDLGRLAAEAGSFALGRVAGADADE